MATHTNPESICYDSLYVSHIAVSFKLLGCGSSGEGLRRACGKLEGSPDGNKNLPIKKPKYCCTNQNFECKQHHFHFFLLFLFNVAFARLQLFS